MKPLQVSSLTAFEPHFLIFFFLHLFASSFAIWFFINYFHHINLEMVMKKKTTMASAMKPISLFLLITSFSSLDLSLIALTSASDPTPAPWPHQFHSIQFMNNSRGDLQVVDLWYDWPNGRNFNIIQNQLGKLLYDLEWDNGTSYYYTLDSNQECKVMHFPVGILRPNWLQGANYLGQRRVDGFLCNVWEKVDFIWYYEDVETKRPVHWLFYTGMSAHVMTFEVGAVLEDPHWQAPVYCFEEEKKGEKDKSLVLEESVVGTGIAGGGLMRGMFDASMWQ